MVCRLMFSMSWKYILCLSIPFSLSLFVCVSVCDWVRKFAFPLSMSQCFAFRLVISFLFSSPALLYFLISNVFFFLTRNSFLRFIQLTLSSIIWSHSFIVLTQVLQCLMIALLNARLLFCCIQMHFYYNKVAKHYLLIVETVLR